jgi:hypothetical protein
MAITYVVFDPAVGFEEPDGGPSKEDLLLRIEAAHYAATQEPTPNQRRIKRLERRHGRVLAAPNARAARQAVNDAIAAEQLADREGREDD